MVSRTNTNLSRYSIKERIPNKSRIEFISFCGEFFGTFMFLFMGFAAAQLANTGLMNPFFP